MKIRRLASSILLASCLFLAGCGQFGLPDPTRHDEVPPDIKAQPRLVESVPPSVDDHPWPRLGDVPFMPKDFSTKPVYDHYMNELAYERAEAQDAKQKADSELPALPDVAVPQTGGGSIPIPPPPGMTPPQLPRN